MRVRHTVTWFKVGSYVKLKPEVGYGENTIGELVKIGRKFLIIKLSDGYLVKRVWPSWVRRPDTPYQPSGRFIAT